MFDFKAPLRDQLDPQRLTIAMWDFSFLLRRAKGEGFEDWDQRLDELVDRGYNTIRIDTFPELILAAQGGKDEFLFPCIDRPHFCWGNVAADVMVRPVEQIPLFLRKMTDRGLKIILSTWWWGGKIGLAPRSPQEATDAWKATLKLMDEHGLADDVLYVDVTNETGFPWTDLMPADGAPTPGTPRRWGHTEEQRKWIGHTFDGILSSLQDEFPHYRYTVSMTGGSPDETLAWDMQHVDVLDYHLFLEDPRFHARSRFSDYSKALRNIAPHGEETFAGFSRRAQIAVDKVGPMMAKWLWQKIQRVKELGEAWCVPVTNTESYGPWFMVEHDDVDWTWLKAWCEMGVRMCAEAEMWGTTTCNYASPQITDLWADREWHQSLNRMFLES